MYFNRNRTAAGGWGTGRNSIKCKSQNLRRDEVCFIHCRGPDPDSHESDLPKLRNRPGLSNWLLYPRRYGVFLPITYLKYIFHVKNLTFCVFKVWIRIRIGLDPWIRIRIEIKSWIRIRI
jgi:hypothetical protein